MYVKSGFEWTIELGVVYSETVTFITSPGTGWCCFWYNTWWYSRPVSLFSYVTRCDAIEEIRVKDWAATLNHIANNAVTSVPYTCQSFLNKVGNHKRNCTRNHKKTHLITFSPGYFLYSQFCIVLFFIMFQIHSLKLNTYFFFRFQLALYNGGFYSRPAWLTPSKSS